MKKIKDFFYRIFGRKVLIGDFSSFALDCPEKDCGWCFHTIENFDKHMREGKHGDEYLSNILPSQKTNLE